MSLGIQNMRTGSSEGHLEVLKWLRDPDLPGGPCPWDKWTCAMQQKVVI